jgi:tripeptidyl-peptidase-1
LIICKVYYNVSSAVQGNALSTQAIFATIEQFFSPADLKRFQDKYQPPAQAVVESIGDHSSDAQCQADANNCAEGNLDLQYIMSTSKVSPTTYWYTDLSWANWLVTVANTVDPPLVFSISYGQEEQTLTTSELDAFNTEVCLQASKYILKCVLLWLQVDIYIYTCVFTYVYCQYEKKLKNFVINK